VLARLMTTRIVGAAVVVAALIPSVAACGSSSKPAYCSDLTNLQSSIKDLSSVTISGGISGLKSQISTIQTDATTLVNSAKSDFPTETSAITASVSRLRSSLASTSVNPTAGQIVGVVAASASVVSSVKGFASATSSKC
jgi:hypothetical protein